MPCTGLISIVGKSGCGKSTLLNLLIGIDTPDNGEIIYLNKNINKLSDKKLKYYQNSEIGILFQHFNLFDELSCVENVVLPKLINGENYNTANDIAEELFKKYNIEYLKDQKFSTLSGGEKERVALLRALINNPKVILADEPTGALDSTNSRFVLDELKKLSKDHLVIIVTHNDELIKEYEDIRLTIIRGKIKFINASNGYERFIYQKKNSNIRIFKTFIKLHLKRHLVRNVIVTCAIAFSSLCMILSLGYIKGASASINKYKSESLLYNCATVAKKSIIDVPNSPIKISKLTRPLDDELISFYDELPSINFLNNYEAIFPRNISFIFDNKTYDDIEFSSVFDFDKYNNLLVNGRMPTNTIEEVVVNEEFVKHFSYSNKGILNHTFTLSYVSYINNRNLYGKTIKDEVIFDNIVKIVGVVKEFAYLNSPRIYYPYIGLDDYLSNIVLKNYSQDLGFDISIKDLVSYADADNLYSSYSYIAFVDDNNDVDKLFELKEKYDVSNEFDIESNAYAITTSYLSMNDVISTSLIVFIVLIVLATIFILIITAYSNFTQNKKESAMLSILGLERIKIFNIYNLENILVSLFGLMISFALAIPFKLLANHIIYSSFNLSNLIAFNLLSYLSLLLILSVIFIASLATFIPFIFYEKGYIIEEIRDE